MFVYIRTDEDVEKYFWVFTLLTIFRLLILYADVNIVYIGHKKKILMTTKNKNI